MLFLNVEVYFLRKLEKECNLSELPRTLNIYGGNIDKTFVLRSNGTLVCNASPIVS